MTVFRDAAPCSLVDTDRRSTGALMMEAVSTSETSVNLYQTTRRNIPEDTHYLVKCVKTDHKRTYKQAYAELFFICSHYKHGDVANF
jgi:hypothetical protein